MTGELYEVTIADLEVLRDHYHRWQRLTTFGSYDDAHASIERLTALDAEIARRRALEET